jgi:hypothetical protein
MRDDERDVHDEWTAIEKSRFDTLPRVRAPSDVLRARTLSELRARGLVRHGSPMSLSRSAWAAVAALIVFIAGGFVGYRLALTRFESQRRLATVVAEPSPSNPSTNTVQSGHLVWF